MLNRVFLLAMIFAGTAGAQQQEQQMMDRIMNPDRDRANPMGEKAFASKPFAGREFRGTGEYAGVKSARTKEYTTREFLGIRNPWFGKKVYATEAASEVRRYLPADKGYASRPVETRTVPDGTRAAYLRDAASPDNSREFVARGKAQGAVSAANPSGGAMTIDEVREMLNRPR